MPRNNSKARKAWRKQQIVLLRDLHHDSPDERILRAIFGERHPAYTTPKPGTESEK